LVPDISIKETLAEYGIREGMIYTFHDNIFAPREYTTTSTVVSFLNKISPLDHRNAKGTAPYDDTDKLMQTSFGRDIYGPEGEVRIIITKI